MFEILLTCLSKADKALLYVKTTQNHPTYNSHSSSDASHQSEEEGDEASRGGGEMGGEMGGRVNRKKSKPNSSKQIHQLLVRNLERKTAAANLQRPQ